MANCKVLKCVPRYDHKAGCKCDHCGEANKKVDDMFKVEIHRRTLTDQSTTGEMLVNGVHECYTLEPPVREVEGQPVAEWKIPDKTAIKAGVYPLTIRHSPRFNRDMPHIENVDGFDGVLIHWGNYPKDTDACTLVGQVLGPQPDFVGSSKLAFAEFFEELLDALASGETATAAYINEFQTTRS